MLNEDYKEMLRALSDHEVRYLIVGAYAMSVHGYPRATGDIDIWVEPSLENSKNTYQALKKFGAPLSQISQETFSKEGIIFQIGVPPRRIDLITKIDGVTFFEAYPKREEIKLEGLKIPFLSKRLLIQNKEATGREKDKVDAKYLRQKRKTT